MQLNQMFGIVAEDVGIMPRNPDEKKDSVSRGFVDILLPSVVQGPSNPYAQAEKVQQQRRAMGR